LTAILSGIAILVGAGLIGDGELTAAQVARVRTDGADWLAVAVVVVVAVGVRSGSRGGPLALERADVRHVLLAPVDRTTAMRGPAIRQLRFLLFVGSIVGAIGGVLAAHRLPGSVAAWAACGALFGLATVALGYGTALVASSVKLRSWQGSLLAVVLVAAAIVGAVASGRQAGAVFGSVALWPLEFEPLGLVEIVLAAGALALGLQLVGDVSVEAAERRSTLVGQLRFAATLQDVRTVIVLRRQLAMELPRIRPWVRLRVRGIDRFAVWDRGLRGIFRWPAARVARLVLLGAVAGFAARAAWAGTTPLVVVSGLALFIAALDAVEPLAQEVDHPSRRDSVPRDDGWVELRHVPVAVLTMLFVALVAAATGVLAGPSTAAVPIAAACVIPGALGAVAGAVVSVVAGAPNAGGDGWSLLPPEVAGMRLAFRTGWPPALAVIGALPVLAARLAARNNAPAPPAAVAVGVGVLVLFVLVCGWLRMRGRIHAWWRAQMELAGRG
jgi:hypothetical protein